MILRVCGGKKIAANNGRGGGGGGFGVGFSASIDIGLEGIGNQTN